MTEWSGSPAVRGASFYAVSDGNGNVSVLVDADSAAGPVETLEYGPFGRVVAQHRADGGAVPAAVPSRCPFGFSSKYLDAGSGLLYFGHRYYSPDLGRWLCRDPLGEKGGANLYAYCQNDPVNAVDPLGLWSLVRWMLTGDGNAADEAYAAAAKTEYEDGTVFSFEASGKVIVGSVSFFENFVTVLYHCGKMNYDGQTPDNNRALALLKAGGEGNLPMLVLRGMREQGERLLEGDPIAIGELVTAAAVATDAASKVSISTGSVMVPTGVAITPGSTATLSLTTTTVSVPVVSGASSAAVVVGGYTAMMAGSGGSGELSPRMTASEADEAARRLGYRRTQYRSHGQPVYTNGRQFITPDVDSHSGGVWEMARSVRDMGSKRTRMGTYDANLNWVGP